MNDGKVILGIHDGHNASVCVLVGGKVAYLVQEERVRYEKNYWGFPTEAVKHALATVGLSAKDIDRVAFSTISGVPRRRDLKATLYAFERLLKPSGLARMALIRLIGKLPYARLKNNMRMRRALLAECGISGGDVKAYGHHACHAAAAYYAMRTDAESDHLVLTLDGAGERHCATVSVASKGSLNRIAATTIPHSLGTIYAFVTFLMGFIPYDHEYKLMGMAPYYDARRAEEAARIFHRYVGLRPDGLGFAKKTLLPMHMQGPSLMRAMRLERFDAICAGLQKFTEDLMAQWTQNCARHARLGKVVCGGGVFMNVKANKRLMELPEVSHLGVLPSCGDESLSYGAAALAHAEMADADEIEPWGAIYFGPEVDDAAARKLLEEKGCAFSRPEDIELEIARLVHAGHPVARCRGRMEFGARALGNRSILADPSKLDSVRVINQMVKKRDFWMPFAPIMLRERSEEYIRNPKALPSPHMMLTFDSRETFPEFLAAVHNADLTARAQLLEERHNPDLHRCLKHFERLSGRGVMLNTSFNLHGYPICLGPNEALHVFENSGLEHLALGPFMVRKVSSNAHERRLGL
ncbi:MAG: Decarbamoylnovobiocin carbamoyltransferase [Phycisphaerae bacterium]|nr:Decarbamoylnovobiocin carbamoyltransferase [Phycisphaerae bacterium]